MCFLVEIDEADAATIVGIYRETEGHANSPAPALVDDLRCT